MKPGARGRRTRAAKADTKRSDAKRSDATRTGATHAGAKRARATGTRAAGAGRFRLPEPWLSRWTGLFVVWVALAGFDPLDLAVGALAAALGARVSLALLPPSGGHVAPAALARLALHLPGQTLAAGWDVARRAFAPRLRLQPGYVVCPCGLPEGTTRAGFRALMSMQPGSLPLAEAADGTLLVHALDIAQPVAAQYARQEAAFAAVMMPRAAAFAAVTQPRPPAPAAGRHGPEQGA